jgi:hypothetical protein
MVIGRQVAKGVTESVNRKHKEMLFLSLIN